MVEIDIGGGQTGMTEKPLDLLQRVAQQPAIAFCAGGRVITSALAEAMLNQHSQHMHREGVAELVRIDPDRKACSGASARCPGKGSFPGVRLYRQADLGQPQGGGFIGGAVVAADDEPPALVRSQRGERDGTAVAQHQCG